MKWDQVTIVNQGKRLTGDAARNFASKQYSTCISTRIKKIVVLNRKECVKYFHGDSAQAKGKDSITDDVTIGAILRAWFGESVILPPSADPPPPKPVPVQRHQANVVRRAPPVLRMFLDADRDGVVDADPPDYDRWTWGTQGYGAILMPVARAWTGTDVVAERVPLEFDWQNGVDDDWQATLAVNFPDRIRIYRGNVANSELLLGSGRLPGNWGDPPPQGKAGPLDLKADGAISGDLAAQRRVRLWMDAPDYPQSETEADWLVTLTLTFKGVAQKAVLRIAPFIMASDLDRTATVYLRDINDDDLTIDPGRDARLKETLIRATGVNALANYLVLQIGANAAVTRQKLPSNASEKGFMRDVMMFGYTSSPSQNRIVFLHELEAVSPLMSMPPSLARNDTSIAVIQRPDGLAIDQRQPQDNGGNYLVSPKRTGYDYGRIIYGDQTGGGLCNAGPFLKAQRIQKPIVLDSTWLDVGHVDEFLTFVPDCSDNANADKPFKVLIASPRLAFLMLWATARQLQENDDADIDLAITFAVQKNREYFDSVLPYDDQPLRSNDRFAPMANSAGPDLPATLGFSTVVDPAPPNPANADGKVVSFSTYKTLNESTTRLWPGQNTRGIAFTPDGVNRVLARNMMQSAFVEVRKDIKSYLETLDQNWTFVLEQIQPKLNTARQTLKDELELEDDDFIEVPVLLKMSDDNKCFFETPDSINMLVLNDWAAGTCTCLVPKPYGPVLNGEYVFERYLTGQLTPLDVTFSFVSDLPFSLHHGEIHCGTNQRHVPLLDPAWWHHKPPNIT